MVFYILFINHLRYKNDRVYSDRPLLAFTTDLNHVIKIWCHFANQENRLYFVLLWEAFLCRRACNYSKCSHIWSVIRWYYRAYENRSAFSRQGLNEGLWWMLEKRQISSYFRRSSNENKRSLLKDAYSRKRLQYTTLRNV